MHEFAYPARFRPDEGGHILVTFRDFPFGATDGADQAEAMTEAVDLLESVLAHCVYHGEEVPLPSGPRRGETLVRPSAVTAAQVALYTAAQVALYTAMRREKVSPKDLAKRLRVPIAEVRRLT